MNIVDGLFIFMNILFSIGTCLLIKTVWKNRKVLNGYNLFGASITLMALLVAVVAYFMMGNWLAILFASITVFYWGLVVFYTLFKKKIS